MRCVHVQPYFHPSTITCLESYPEEEPGARTLKYIPKLHQILLEVEGLYDLHHTCILCHILSLIRFSNCIPSTAPFKTSNSIHAVYI